MRKAIIKIHDQKAGILIEENHQNYVFQYDKNYQGPVVSLTMSLVEKNYHYEKFPPFFEGLLPEGIQLEGLLKKYKIDKQDYFQQLIQTGSDLVGAITVEAYNPTDE